MDFIKTSSLRALIELTFQRNWNGLIWMSRKGVIAKRVKTAPDGSIENQRRTAQTGWPRNECSALGQNPRGRPRHNATPAAHDQPREPGNASRPRNLSRTTADASVRAGKHVPSGRETIGQSSSVRPHRPTVKSSGHDRSDSAKDPTVRPIVPTDRPNAAVDPKPFLKPNPHNSSPKPAPT
ncbi:unnamed protein product [Microthlaspi erraticum]|uniref:Uncharacterized protein n=1 Tax=Microthlaspi erraticum TaxID=1685480 RepID=A0A6D2JYB0_9BRAS|nr:unnamed protein product [Microthlaspi erraticum]